jgi:hypothetical protein
MDESQKPAEERESESERRTANLILLAMFVVVVGIGVWLVFALDTARKADDCLSQGRRNCFPLDAPSR